MKVQNYSDEELANILDNETFHLISDVADKMQLECYLVGGYVRDIFLDQPSDDIDCVVVGSGIKIATELKKRLGKRAYLSVFKNFGTAQVKIMSSGNRPPLEIEFVGARRESYQRDSRKPIVEDGTLEDDQNRRDFTINAMAICLNKDRFGELIDPFGGLDDLWDGIIRTPLDPDITFSDDPLRMLRCIRFATRFNFLIEDETFNALERNVERLKIISKERISEELNKHRTEQDDILLRTTPDFLYQGKVVSFISSEFVDCYSYLDPNPSEYKIDCMKEFLASAPARWKHRYPNCEVIMYPTNHDLFWRSEPSLTMTADCL